MYLRVIAGFNAAARGYSSPVYGNGIVDLICRIARSIFSCCFRPKTPPSPKVQLAVGERKTQSAKADLVAANAGVQPKKAPLNSKDYEGMKIAYFKNHIREILGDDFPINPEVHDFIIETIADRTNPWGSLSIKNLDKLDDEGKAILHAFLRDQYEDWHFDRSFKI